VKFEVLRLKLQGKARKLSAKRSKRRLHYAARSIEWKFLDPFNIGLRDPFHFERGAWRPERLHH
jgi:hypothetical protein